MAEEKKSKTTKGSRSMKSADKPSADPEKKKATRKPPQPDFSKDPNYKPLSKKEIKDFTQQLLDQRNELLGNVDQMHKEALKDSRQESSGDLSSMPIHMADIGTDNYEQEFTLGLIESERKMLKDIDIALIKVKEGTYGTCEATSEPIGRIRLDAKPYARYCIEHARKLEQGLVKETSEDNQVAEPEEAAS